MKWLFSKQKKKKKKRVTETMYVGRLVQKLMGL